ncbi:hypothetical protein Tco_1164977 [Tanacetum coccineum]
MIEADEQLAARLQAEEQKQFSIEEKSRMLVEMIAERKKFFLKEGSYEEIQKLFDKAYKQVNLFIPIDSEVVKSSETRIEGSSKKAEDGLESDKSKKQKIDEHVEAKKDDDQEEAEMKKHIEIVKDDEVVIDVIPLATKPPMIVEYKIDKDGRMGYFKLIRADGSSKRYSSMIKMHQDIDREDLETLWKLVKAKHGNTRPEEDYKRVLWGMYDIDLLWSRFFPFNFPFMTEDDSVCEACGTECNPECRVRKGVVKNMASNFRNMMALGFGLHIMRMMASGFAGVMKNGRMMV